MKTPKTITCTWVIAVCLFAVGIFVDNHSAVGTSVVIMVVLSCTLEILEAIHKNNKE